MHQLPPPRAFCGWSALANRSAVGSERKVHAQPTRLAGAPIAVLLTESLLRAAKLGYWC